MKRGVESYHGSPKITHTPRNILALIDGGESFRKELYCVCSFMLFHGHQQTYENRLILNSLGDTSRIRRFDRCTYTMIE